MKNTILICLALGLLFASACNKNSSASTHASFQWTYSGATFTADTVLAAKGDSLFGIYYLPQIYAQTGAWNTPQTAFTANINSLNVGSYGDGGSNSFTYYVPSTGNSQITPFSITISSVNNGLLNGNFTGTLNGQTITGTFSNVAVH